MDVPVDELRPGVHLPLSRDLRFGRHRPRVTGVDVVTREQPALVPWGGHVCAPSALAR